MDARITKGMTAPLLRTLFTICRHYFDNRTALVGHVGTRSLSGVRLFFRNSRNDGIVLFKPSLTRREWGKRALMPQGA
jgi:hypothetical protein